MAFFFSKKPIPVVEMERNGMMISISLQLFPAENRTHVVF